MIILLSKLLQLYAKLLQYIKIITLYYTMFDNGCIIMDV